NKYLYIYYPLNSRPDLGGNIIGLFYISLLFTLYTLYFFQISSKSSKVDFISSFLLVLIATIKAFIKLIGATNESTKESISLLAIREISASFDAGETRLSVILIILQPFALQ